MNFTPEHTRRQKEHMARRELLRRGAEALEDLAREKRADARDVRLAAAGAPRAPRSARALAQDSEGRRWLRAGVIASERRLLVRLRNEGAISDEVRRGLGQESDPEATWIGAGDTRSSHSETHRLATCALAFAALTGAQIEAQSCGDPGYPLAVSALSPAELDSGYLAGVARSFAYRWQVPSNRRQELSAWRRVRERSLPPEPRWADDLTPEPSLRASMRVTILKNGRLRAAAPEPVSGERSFDRSLPTIASDPLPQPPEMPVFPAGVAGDSVIVLVTFGGEPPAGAAFVRFAAQQTPVHLTPGTLEVRSPRPSNSSSPPRPSATVKYDVTETGGVDPRSIEILETSDRALGKAIRDALVRALFRPATSNCRPIRMTVLLKFGN